MSIACLNTLGLLACFVGFVLLFRYGMPFRVRTDGATYLVTHQVDESEQALERRYERLGWLGFALVSIGTALQIAANWA